MIHEQQYLYHHTRVANLKSILEKGLETRNGTQSKAVNDKKTKIFFSEGMEGAIAMSARFQHTFDNMKTGTEWEDKNLEDFLEESVFLRFLPDGIQNESNKQKLAFMDGWTSRGIEAEKLKVCLLRNKVTGDISYQRDDILKYMISVNPIENFKNGDEWIKEDIKKYYKERSEDLSKFNSEDYSLEDMELDRFIEQNIAKRKETLTPRTSLSKEKLFTPREIGKATVNAPTEMKDKAENYVKKDEHQLQETQEIEDDQLQ